MAPRRTRRTREEQPPDEDPGGPLPASPPAPFDVWVDRIIDPVMPDDSEPMHPALLDWLAGETPQQPVINNPHRGR